MKRIQYLAIPFLFLLVALLSGCDKFLVRNSPTATTDDQWWTTQAQLQGYLNSIYLSCVPVGTIQSGSQGGGFSQAQMPFSGLSDESVWRSNYIYWNYYPDAMATSSESSIAKFYTAQYNCIRNCNRIMANYQSVFMTDTALQHRYAVEARALRAYAHFQLYMFFGPIPIITTAVALPNAGNLARGSEDSVTNFIVTELDTCAAYLPATYPQSDVYRITSGACYAIIMKLYLQQHNYAKAIEYAQKIINSNVYSLYKTTAAGRNSYSDLFGYNALNNSEFIITFSLGSAGAFFRYAPLSLGGQAGISPTAAMINTYETLQGKTLQELGSDSLNIYWADPLYKNNRDPRLFASILVPGERFSGTTLGFNTAADPLGGVGSTFTGYWCKKYVDSTDKSTHAGKINFGVIRYADVLLSYVEALVESGDWQNPDVAKYINQIRNRAGMPNYDPAEYNTQDMMRQLYRRERMVELAFEGWRYWDIKRWNIGAQVLNGPVQGAINPATGQPVVAETRTFSANQNYLFPIPLAEMEANTAMTQNTGW